MDYKSAIDFTVEYFGNMYNLKGNVISQLKKDLTEGFEKSNSSPAVSDSSTSVSNDETHHTTGGVDEEKNVDGFGGFANGAL